MTMPIRILIAEDEQRTRNGVLNALQQSAQGQWLVGAVDNGLEALEYIRRHPTDLLITDIRMPGLSGIELLERLKIESKATVSVMLSGYAEFEYARTALKFGAVNYILKPFDQKSLIEAVHEAVQVVKERKPQTDIPVEDDGHFPKVQNESIRKALQYIEAELHRPSLSIKDVADHIHLNASYTSVLFKDEIKETFSDFVNRMRLNNAKELLKRTNKKVYEVAESVGFSSSKHFIQVFRDLEGMTPSQYRNDLT